MYKEIIVTIDIGSSKIVAAAGKKDEKGAIHILALETEATKTSVYRGRIYNVGEVSRKIKSLLNRLNNKLDEKITKIYVGVGGQSLVTETYPVVEKTEETIINEQLLRSLREKCKYYRPILLEVLDVVFPEYLLDGKSEEKPIGVSCKKIEAKFQIILGNPAIKRNINICILDNNVEIAGYFIAPLATANAVLTDLEKNLGCALIEFGAGVTYLSVYKNNLLKYLVTIPIGANVITKDIVNLNIMEDEAENLKIAYGHALVDNDDDNYPVKIMANNKEIDIDDLNDIIEARVDEIIANIKKQLEISGFSNTLGGGIIITGGGAALRNLSESIEEKTKQKVRIATVKKGLIVNDSSEYGKLSGIEETVGLLSLGTENCIKPKEVEKPVSQPPEAEKFNDFLFSKDEVEVVEKEKNPRGKRKPPVGQEENKKIKKGIVLSLIDKMSKDLFNSADSTDEEEEDENDKINLSHEQ